MDIITKILCEAWKCNLQYVILLDITLAFLYVFNIALGSIIGAKNDKFSIKKFLFGIMKAVAVLLIIVGVCYILNVFTLTISEIEGITISTEIVSSFELVSVMIVQGADLAKEVSDKIKSFRDLKYQTYDDVKISSDQGIIEPSDQRG